MTKFWLWILGEDTEQHLDLAAKVGFNVMMLGISWFLLMNVAGLVLSFYFLLRVLFF